MMITVAPTRTAADMLHLLDCTTLCTLDSDLIDDLARPHTLSEYAALHNLRVLVDRELTIRGL